MTTQQRQRARRKVPPLVGHPPLFNLTYQRRFLLERAERRSGMVQAREAYIEAFRPVYDAWRKSGRPVSGLIADVQTLCGDRNVRFEMGQIERMAWANKQVRRDSAAPGWTDGH